MAEPIGHLAMDDVRNRYEGVNRLEGGPIAAIEYRQAVEEREDQNNPERLSELSRLSKEAQEVVLLVLHTPDELLQFLLEKPSYKGRITRNVLRYWLRERLGWRPKAIKSVFGELRKMFSGS